ncbi:AAA family ATPase [Bifidobacterium animalis]|uniref:AAA family ATPase n=1 Tax=Bifidobacterium animalis TaxID=28025 RepID=UPI0009BAE0FD|nr:AAA family ATPase [Bifidobacterium animalis]
MVGMELEVAGIGRIAGAKIRLDGVTVIAGENNTGKTTIGKAALALIDGRFDLDRRMTDATRRTIQNAVQDGMIPADEDETWSQRRQTILQASERTDRFLESPDMSVEDFLTALCDDGLRLQDIDAVRTQIEAAMNLKLTEYAASQIDLRLSSLFHEDALSRVDGYGDYHRLALHTDDGAVTSMSWAASDEHVFDGDSFAGPNAVWVDTPALIENLDGMFRRGLYGRFRGDDRHVAMQAIMDAEYNAAEEEWHPDDRTRGIIRAIEQITPVSLERRPDMRGRQFHDQTLDVRDGEALKLHNASMGVKSLLLLHRLVSTGVVRAGTVLILDEPEIHLHPKWQLSYAKILMMLAKQMDVKVLVTTHSPYFLDALHVYMEREGMLQRFHVYLPESDAHGMDVFNEADETQQAAYMMRLAEPFDELDRVRDGMVK